LDSNVAENRLISDCIVSHGVATAHPMSEAPTYKVIGGDSKEYGPYSIAELQTWIQEGRIQTHSQLSRSDVEGWHPANRFPEFSWPGVPIPNPATQAQAQAQPAPAQSSNRISFDQIDPGSLAGIRAAASWLFWIAALSAVNVVLAVSGSGFSFSLGSLAVDWLTALGANVGGPGIALVFGLGSSAAWAGMGWAARRGHRWAFVLAMILFAFDSLLLLGFFSLLGAAIHAYVLYRLFEGLRQSWVLQSALKKGA
jgi:GYF domain 2